MRLAARNATRSHMPPLVSVSQRFISTEALSNIPYVFRNQSELVHKKEKTKAEDLHAIQEMLSHPEFNLKEGFGMAYYAYLQGIRDRSEQELTGFCERNLVRAMTEGFEEINNEV